MYYLQSKYNNVRIHCIICTVCREIRGYDIYFYTQGWFCADVFVVRRTEQNTKATSPDIAVGDDDDDGSSSIDCC